MSSHAILTSKSKQQQPQQRIKVATKLGAKFIQIL